MTMTHNTLLRGVVGSTAYGLAREGSDVDRLGVFATSSSEIAGWDWTSSRESVVSHNPDSTSHEVRKFLKLAIKGNPTVNELLWLDEYETYDWLGAQLVALRYDLICTPAVANAYLGYAVAQRAKFQRAAADPATVARSKKFARHALRLLEQAETLMLTGRLQLRVADPDWYFELDEMDEDAIMRRFEMRMHLARAAEERSVLRDEPDVSAARAFLGAVRRYYP